MLNRYTTTSRTTQDDYFAESVIAELMQNSPSQSQLGTPTSQNVLSTTAISSVTDVNGSPYQQSAHSVVIKRYAIKRT